MYRILVWIACAATGFWIGAHRLIPLWGIVSLAVLGGVFWCVGEWQERREGNGDDAS